MNPHTITDPYGHVVNIVPDDTNPAYHGIGMFSGEGLFQGFGNTMVDATTTLPNVEVFASDNPKNIVVINKNPSLTQNATFSLNDVNSGTIDVWRKDEAVLFPNPPIKPGTLSLQNGTFSYQLPPFSVTTFVLHTQSGAALTNPPSPTTTATPNPTHTPNSTSFSTTVFLHGIGKGGDNVNPSSGGNNTPLHGFALVREQKKRNELDMLFAILQSSAIIPVL